MNVEIIIENQGDILARANGGEEVVLCYPDEYKEGDTLVFHCEKAGYFKVQLEDTLQPVVAYSAGGEFRFPIPFGEKRSCYAPRCFVGKNHLLWVRTAMAEEITGDRNLAINPLDWHGNKVLYPHAQANIETRNQACFAAHNAIDGMIAGDGHGLYPYGSWGINQREDAELTISFGRQVWVKKLVVTLRSDFPHDNWWQSAVFHFSDGSKEMLRFQKTGRPQKFDLTPRKVEFVTMCHLKKDPTDPSPFPALRQLEIWGCDLNLD